jgi:hypothetical protein
MNQAGRLRAERSREGWIRRDPTPLKSQIGRADRNPRWAVFGGLPQARQAFTIATFAM